MRAIRDSSGFILISWICQVIMSSKAVIWYMEKNTFYLHHRSTYSSDFQMFTDIHWTEASTLTVHTFPSCMFFVLFFEFRDSHVSEARICLTAPESEISKSWQQLQLFCISVFLASVITIKLKLVVFQIPKWICYFFLFLVFIFTLKPESFITNS